MKLTGNTYAWKKQLAAAGFTWDAAAKAWSRNTELNTEEFGDRMISNGIESGELRTTAAAANNRLPRNAREAMEFESGVKYV